MRRILPYWPVAWRWGLLALAALCIGALFVLVGSAAFDKDSAVWARWLLLLLAVLAIGATLLTSDIALRRAGLLRSIVEPRNVAILFLAGLTAFGAMSDAVNLFAPRPVVEGRPYEMRDDLKAVRAAVERKAAKQPAARIRTVLPGRWGEQAPACGLVWRFAISGDALVAEIVKRPVGVAPYRLEATVTRAEGDVMEIVGNAPAEADGSAATLRYTTDGATERLVWDDRKRATDLQEYRRC